MRRWLIGEVKGVSLERTGLLIPSHPVRYRTHLPKRRREMPKKKEDYALAEPDVHPAAREEMEQRVSLRDAIVAESELLLEASKLVPDSMQGKIFDEVSYALGRIVDRWEKGTVFGVDAEKKRFTRKEKDGGK